MHFVTQLIPEVSTPKMGENWADLSHCNKKYAINCLMQYDEKPSHACQLYLLF